jgi:hypothetical protein
MTLEELESELAAYAAAGMTISLLPAEDSALVTSVAETFRLRFPPAFVAFYAKYRYAEIDGDDLESLATLCSEYSDQVEAGTLPSRTSFPIVRDNLGSWYYVVCASKKRQPDDFGRVVRYESRGGGVAESFPDFFGYICSIGRRWKQLHS